MRIPFLIYKYNDMVWTFVYAFSRYNHTEAHINISNLNKFDMITHYLNSVLFLYVHPYLAFYLLIAFYSILSLIFSYILFKHLVKNIFLAVLFALMFTFCNYFLYRIMSFTVALYAIYLFPLTFYLLVKKANYIWLALITTLAIAWSLYYGYMVTIIILLWHLIELVFSRAQWRRLVRGTVLYTLLVSSFVLVVYGNYILSNIPVLGNYTTGSKTTIYRPVEDYYNFAIKPRYLVLPPNDSLPGYLISRVLTVETAVNDDESGGLFLGYDLLAVLIIFPVLFVIRKLKRKVVIGQKTDLFLIKLYLLMGLIVLISLPPTFTIIGVKITTPSYFIYQLLPMFRVLVRWAIVIQLISLVIYSVLLTSLLPKIKYPRVFVIGLVLFHTLNTLLFIPKLDVYPVPSDIAYLKDVNSVNYSFTVYPKGDYRSIFWTSYHNKTLINPTGYGLEYKGVLTETISKMIATDEGIAFLKANRVSYLVFNTNAEIPDSIKLRDKIYFNKTLGKSNSINGFYIYNINETN
jgi:hypothetical protein